MKRVEAEIDDGLLAFLPGSRDRLLLSSHFIGRAIDSPMVYQLVGLNRVVGNAVSVLSRFQAATRDAVEVSGQAADTPANIEARRIARKVNPLVEFVERRGTAALVPALRPRRISAAIASLRAYQSDPTVIREPRARDRVLAALAASERASTLGHGAAQDEPVSATYAIAGDNYEPPEPLPPLISSVAPPSGPPGSSVRVTGVRFGSQQFGTITFGGVTAAVIQWTSTAVTATVPALPPGNVPVRVNAGGDTSDPKTFTVEGAPSVAGGSGATNSTRPTAGIGETDPTLGTVSQVARALMDSSLGYLFYHRTRITPKGFALGEHLYTLSLAPGEEATIEQRSYMKRDVPVVESCGDGREAEVLSSFATELAEAVTRERELTSKLDVASTKSVTGRSATPIPTEIDGSSSLDIAGSISAAASSTDSSSTQRMFERTKTVAAWMREQHKTTFALSEPSEERKGRRVIRNPNRGASVDLHYFKMMGALDLRHERYGIRLCWAPFVMDPGAAVRQRAAEAAVAARSASALQLRPELPAEAERGRAEASSLPIELASHFRFWNDVHVELDIPIEAAGRDWDGTAPRVTLSFTGRRPAAAYFVGNPWRDGTRLMARVHVDIGWTLVEERGTASLRVAIGTVDVSDPVVAKAMSDYRRAMAVWEQDIAHKRAEAAQAAGVSSGDLTLDAYEAMNELLVNALVSHFAATSREDFREVDFWSRLFDIEHGGYALYPGNWSGPLPVPDREASDFLNASWARIFLPIRAGYERVALTRLLTGAATPASPSQQAIVDAIVTELEAYRTEHFGSAYGVEIDPDTRQVRERYDVLAAWSETTPTDGTHLEAVLSATTALDDSG